MRFHIFFVIARMRMSDKGNVLLRVYRSVRYIFFKWIPLLLTVNVLQGIIMFDFGAILTEIILKMRIAESDCVIILKISLQLSYILMKCITIYKMNNM